MNEIIALLTKPVIADNIRVMDAAGQELFRTCEYYLPVY